jgi:hypothetical protein
MNSTTECSRSGRSYRGETPDRYKPPSTMSTNFSKHLAVQVDKETREITAYLKGDVSQSDDDSAVRETLLQLERQNDKTAKKRLQDRTFFSYVSDTVNGVKVGFGTSGSGTKNSAKKPIPPSIGWRAKIYDEDREPGLWKQTVMSKDSGFVQFPLGDCQLPPESPATEEQGSNVSAGPSQVPGTTNASEGGQRDTATASPETIKSEVSGRGRGGY